MADTDKGWWTNWEARVIWTIAGLWMSWLTLQAIEAIRIHANGVPPSWFQKELYKELNSIKESTQRIDKHLDKFEQRFDEIERRIIREHGELEDGGDSVEDPQSLVLTPDWTWEDGE